MEYVSKLKSLTLAISLSKTYVSPLLAGSGKTVLVCVLYPIYSNVSV